MKLKFNPVLADSARDKRIDANEDWPQVHHYDCETCVIKLTINLVK